MATWCINSEKKIIGQYDVPCHFKKIGQAYRGLTGAVLLLRIFSVAISVRLHVCFIFDLFFISMFLR